LFKADGYTELVQSFKLSLQVAGLKAQTIKHYTSDTKKFLEHISAIPPDDISPNHLRQYLDSLRIRVSPKTVYEVQLALRKFFRFMSEEREIEFNPCDGIKLTKYRVAPQPIYSVDEIKNLLSSCVLKTSTGTRDYAIMTMLFDTAVRVRELISMDAPDWGNRLIRVDGETGIRYVPLGIGSLQALDRYIRKWHISGKPFWRGKNGTFTSSGVLQMARRRCRDFDISYKGVHAFRRSAAAEMKRTGMNDSDIMTIMGWQDVTMLRRYVSNVGLELAQLAHERFNHSPAKKSPLNQPIPSQRTRRLPLLRRCPPSRPWSTRTARSKVIWP